jgi:hypothetical protein
MFYLGDRQMAIQWNLLFVYAYIFHNNLKTIPREEKLAFQKLVSICANL